MTHPLHAELESARLIVKPIGSIPGAVDGAWWPRSPRLPDELLEILPAIHERLHHLDRVCYRTSSWDAAPRKIVVDGEFIRLDGYVLQELETVRLVGRDGTLLIAVVPFDAEPDVAHLAMLLAMTGAGGQAVHDLNVAAANTVRITRQTRVAEADWESEGGHPLSGPLTLEEAS